MRDALRQLVVPIFIFLCIVLGGSAQSVWGVLVLQILAILLIAWAAVFAIENTSLTGRTLLPLVLSGVLLIGMQLVPLPPELWRRLPGREMVEQGYRALGQQLPWQAISLTPYRTLATILFLLPPIAIVTAVVRLKAYRESWIAAAMLSATLLGILLGYVQVSTKGQSDWYVYEITNLGSAVGFFANRNHMGTLLIMTVPFVVALFFGSVSESRRHALPMAITGGVAIIAILLGIALNGSLAAISLAVPVTAASALLVPTFRRFRVVLATLAGIALIGALIVLANSPVQPKLTGETTASFEGRWEIWQRTATVIENTFPVGTGFGSFEQVYGGLEPAKSVSRKYVNHAHNDYLELIVESGLLGALLVLVFIAWWARQSARIFASPSLHRFAAAATIASGAALAHSVVDYPLRTTAIAATFALCVALMVTPRPAQTASRSGGQKRRPARHIKIG